MIKPGGRLIIGEELVDPDRVSPRSLREATERAGFVFERKAGSVVSYLAIVRRPAAVGERA